jgi:predicted phage baseplate assembly protein
MSQQTDTSLTDLCGCCEGLVASTPVEVYNRPGLAAIAYRVGTHSLFKESMLARLSASDLPALRGLNTRDDDDFTVALADAWAMVADVLTFYQERIANESYLRTATERISLLELARLIGYEPRPGVAASTYLAFKLEDAPGASRTATIDAGTKVQSLPGQDELPQTFETVEKIEARVEWNELRPRRSQPRVPAFQDTHTYLEGVTTGLQPGDPLLIVGPGRETDAGSEQWEIRYVSSVEPDVDADRTLVHWDEPLGSTTPFTESPVGGARVYALRLRASLFGYNAPQWEVLPAFLRDGIYANRNQTYADANLRVDSTGINLDAVYPQIVAGSWIVLVRVSPADAESYRVEAALEEARADYAISAKSTRLELSGENLSSFSPRTTTVYAQSEELPLAEYPIDEDVGGNRIELDSTVEGLAGGRAVLVTGATTGGGRGVEPMTIEDVSTSPDGLTVLRFDGGLANTYQVQSVVIYANVAPATHGETREEVLGSGDASVAYRRFALREAPLTYIRSTAPGGAQSTLQVRVNDVLWREVRSLYGHGPNERVYVTRSDDDGKTTIQFGDGRAGARPPTGQENVRATYRKGIGLEGMVEADQLSLLLTRPLGVRSVTNPRAATDAADPEPHDEVRRNAPLTVLTLDRIVSLRDHEDFASAYAGISKALATRVWDGDARGVFVTVAGPGASKPSKELLADLLAAMREAGDPHHPLFVEPFQQVLFNVKASVEVNAAFLPERVLAAVEESLRARFSFEARSFGEPIALSDVVTVIQEVSGVVAVDVNAFYRGCEGLDDDAVAVLGRQCVPGALNPRLDARGPQISVPESGAELLTLGPSSLEIEEMP